MSSSTSNYLDQLGNQLFQQVPFSYLAEEQYRPWISEAKLLKLNPGQTLLSNRQLQDRIYLVIDGQVRLLAESEGEIITLQRRGAGQFLGWISLLRADACEWVTASSESVVLALPASGFLDGYQNCSKFAEWFNSLSQSQETFVVLSSALDLAPQRLDGWRNKIISNLDNSCPICVPVGESFVPPKAALKDTIWLVSTDGVPNMPVGTIVNPGDVFEERLRFHLPHRLIGFPPLGFDLFLPQLSQR